MRTQPVESEHQQQSSHPALTATLLMIGVALAIVLIAAAGVVT